MKAKRWKRVDIQCSGLYKPSLKDHGGSCHASVCGNHSRLPDMQGLTFPPSDRRGQVPVRTVTSSSFSTQPPTLDLIGQFTLPHTPLCVCVCVFFLSLWTRLRWEIKWNGVAAGFGNTLHCVSADVFFLSFRQQFVKRFAVMEFT